MNVDNKMREDKELSQQLQQLLDEHKKLDPISPKAIAIMDDIKQCIRYQHKQT